MSNQPHGIDQPHGLDPSLNQQLPLDQQHGLDQRDEPHRLSLPLDEPHEPDLPLGQSHGPDLPPDLPHRPATSDSESGQSSSASESVSDYSPGSSDFPAEPPKICYTCAQFLPASQFRFRNRATGVRMTECRTCYNKRTKDWHRKKRACEKGWEIHKTASQIARSPDINRTVALLENLVAVMGGPEKLIEQWHAECWKLTNQKRSSTRLARMHEMLIVLMGQTSRAKQQRAAAVQPRAAG